MNGLYIEWEGPTSVLLLLPLEHATILKSLPLDPLL